MMLPALLKQTEKSAALIRAYSIPGTGIVLLMPGNQTLDFTISKQGKLEAGYRKKGTCFWAFKSSECAEMQRSSTFKGPSPSTDFNANVYLRGQNLIFLDLLPMTSIDKLTIWNRKGSMQHCMQGRLRAQLISLQNTLEKRRRGLQKPHRYMCIPEEQQPIPTQDFQSKH